LEELELPKCKYVNLEEFFQKKFEFKNGESQLVEKINNFRKEIRYESSSQVIIGSILKIKQITKGGN